MQTETERVLMRRQGPDESEGSGEESPPDRRRAAMVLLVVLLLVIGGLALVRQLHSMASIQDCALSGRTNCAPITPGGR